MARNRGTSVMTMHDVEKHGPRKAAEIALINNYLTDPDTRASEWQDYQDWRNFAKNYTNNTLGIKK